MKNRLVYIDVLKIIGALMVFFIHSRASSVWGNADVNFIVRIIYMIVTILSRSAVPLFMMITGSLLLSKDETTKVILTKRVLRSFLVIVFIAFLCLIQTYINSKQINIKGFIYDVFNLVDRRSIVFWFLYWWLSFTIFLPIYQKFAKSINEDDYKYIITICIVFNILFPVLNSIFSIINIEEIKMSSQFTLFMVADGLFYPFIGYYIDHLAKDSKITKTTNLILIILVSVLISVLLTLITMTGDATLKQSWYFTPIITICIYKLVRNLFFKFDNEKVSRVISFLGTQTIGIYLFHVFIPDSFSVMLSSIISPVLGVHVYKIINFVVKFLLCAFITAALRLIKPFKKIL